MNLVAQFKDGVYKTNREFEISAIETSLAFKDDLIVDYDAMIQEGRERRAAELAETVLGDPVLTAAVAKKLGLEGKKGK